MKPVVIAAFFLVILCPAARIAEATLVEIALVATIDYTYYSYGPGGSSDDNPFAGYIGVGDVITGSYRYDTLTPDSDPLWPEGGIYRHYESPYGISLTVGEFDFQTDPDNVDFIVSVKNNFGEPPPQLDGYLIRSYNNLPLDNGFFVDHISWQLNDLSATALASDALPTGPPVLEDWQQWAGLRIESFSTDQYGSVNGWFSIHAEVTSVALVPEPTALLFLALGSAVVARKR